MPKDIVIHGQGLDQSLPLEQTEVDRAKYRIRKVVNQALKDGDPQGAFDYGKQLIKNVQIKGVELAHLIYLLHTDWKRWGLQEELVDRIVVEWGLHKQTVQRYLGVEQEVLENEDIPEVVRRELTEKSMNFLIKLVRPAREGKFDEENWEEVAMLPDEASVRTYVNETIGKSPRGRKPEYTYSLYSDGSFIAFGKDGERVPLGVLRSKPKDLEDNIRRKAINNLRDKLGVKDI